MALVFALCLCGRVAASAGVEATWHGGGGALAAGGSSDLIQPLSLRFSVMDPSASLATVSTL